MITLPVGAAEEFHSDLLISAQGTMPCELATAPRYRRLAKELAQCTGSADYVELNDELAEIATKFGFLG